MEENSGNDDDNVAMASLLTLEKICRETFSFSNDEPGLSPSDCLNERMRNIITNSTLRSAMDGKYDKVKLVCFIFAPNLQEANACNFSGSGSGYGYGFVDVGQKIP